MERSSASASIPGVTARILDLWRDQSTSVPRTRRLLQASIAIPWRAAHNTGEEISLTRRPRHRPLAPPGQEGWMRHQEKVAIASLTPQTGWLFKVKSPVFEQPPR